ERDIASSFQRGLLEQFFIKALFYGLLKNKPYIGLFSREIKRKCKVHTSKLFDSFVRALLVYILAPVFLPNSHPFYANVTNVQLDAFNDAAKEILLVGHHVLHVWKEVRSVFTERIRR